MSVQTDEGFTFNYYNQVVISAHDLETIRLTGANVPQSKRAIIKSLSGKILLNNNVFRSGKASKGQRGATRIDREERTSALKGKLRAT